MQMVNPQGTTFFIRLRFCLLLSSALLISLIKIAAAEDSVDKPKFSVQQLEFFESQIRPLLIKRCFECHGPEVDELEGGLSLASRENALMGGDTGPAIVAGNSKESLLIESINYGDLYEMPPSSKMPDDEIELFTRWIDMGAPWTPGEKVQESRQKFDLAQRAADHWVWRPVVRPDLPGVTQADWSKDELDLFILKKLEARGLHPAADADRPTWLRRVYFDLIGLPPTPDQVAAFVNDNSADAFANVVDELLDSPRFGERWARHWMDLVRYAETCGHEFDYPIPHAYQYRDYLIRAFNQDVPYDQLIREHLAGDLLPQPRLSLKESYNESLIGTGFWFMGEAKHSPVDVRGEEAGYIDNRIDVMSKTFLGMTVACARCHDHKFDAITTKDFYGLAGFLKSSRRQTGMLDPQGKIQQTAQQLRTLESELQAMFVQSRDSLRDDFLSKQQIETYLLTTTAVARSLEKEATDEQVQIACAAAAKSANLDVDRLKRWLSLLRSQTVQDDSHPLFVWYESAMKQADFQPNRVRELQHQQEKVDLPAGGKAATSKKAAKSKKAAATKKSTAADWTMFADFTRDDLQGWFLTGEAFTGALQQHDRVNVHETNARWVSAGTVHSGVVAPQLQGVLRSPTFTLTSDFIDLHIAGKNFEVALIIDGYDMFRFNGLLFNGVSFGLSSPDRFTWHRQSQDVSRYKGHRAYLEIIDQGDGWVALDQIVFTNGPRPTTRNDVTTALQVDAELTMEKLASSYARLAQADEAASDARRQWLGVLTAHHLLDEDQNSAQLSNSEKTLQEAAASVTRPILVQAMTDGTPENEFVFIRGNHKTLGDEAPRHLLEVLDGDKSYGGNQSSGRLELADEIASADNPLTSRVIVNRLWHHMTGRGIVASTDNFGVLGQRPSHPELLDYLASEFMRENWSIKAMLRRIALSRTYRMSSQKESGDSLAETTDPENIWLHRMRVRRLEGETIRDSLLQISGRIDLKMFGPSVPIHLTEFMEGRGRPGQSGPLDGGGRRSVYIEVRRNFLSPLMRTFDTPQPFSTVGQRNQSNVPAQALILMNDPFVREQTNLWADQLQKKDNLDIRQRITLLYQQAFGRPPSESELKQGMEFITVMAEDRQLKQDDPQVWREYCHVLVNLKEFIYIR
jgi:hypothetical protein